MYWRASKRNPCPVCRGDHSCSATADGLHFCLRSHADTAGWRFLKDSSNGFGLFRSDADDFVRDTTPRESRPRQPTQAKEQRRDPPAIDCHAIHAAAVDGELVRLGGMLGVTPDSLRRQAIRYEPETENERELWLCPERDASGTMIGFIRRYLTGTKKRYPGGRSGLSFDPSSVWVGPVLLVEGPTDVAAALTLGLQAVGRPSNLGGVDLLADLLRDFASAGGEVLVVAENDKKADGRWPGMEGAEKTAQQLADAWGVDVPYTLPPDGIKDLRNWLVRQDVDLNNRAATEEAGRRFLEAAKCLTNVKQCRRSSKDIREEIREEREKNGDAYRAPATSPEPGPAFREVIRAGCNPRPCPSHYVPLLQRRDAPHHAAALRVDCRRFSCAACGPRRRCRWLVHLDGVFRSHKDELFALDAPTDPSVRTLIRRVQRLKGDFAAVRMTGGRTAIITTVNVPDAVVAEPADASEHIAAALLNLADCLRPITTSAAWRLLEDRKRANVYQRKGEAPKGKFDEALGQLARDGMPPAVSDYSTGKRATWTFPPDWPEERIDFYFDCLGGGPDPDPDP